MSDWKWQWVSDHFGEMGWFTDEDKLRVEGTEEFAEGHWRPLSPEEVADFKRYVGRLAYEQF